MASRDRAAAAAGPGGVRCRDPKDDVYVALAAAEGVALVTGDADLMALRRLGPVEILSAGAFAARVGR